MNASIILCFVRNIVIRYSRMLSAEYIRQQIYHLCSEKGLVEVLELNVQTLSAVWQTLINPFSRYHCLKQY